MSSEYNEKIEELLKNEIVDRHSFFQLKYFVIGKEPTIQAKLWRCLRELQSRKETIDSINLELEDIEDRKLLMIIEMEKLRQSIENNNFQAEIEIKTRQIKRKIEGIDRSKNSMCKKLKFAKEEASFFYEAYQSLEKKEKIKPFDDIKAQTEYWEQKLRSELEMRMLLRQPLDIELVKAILSLSDDAPIKKETINILNDSFDRQNKLDSPKTICKE